MVAAVVKIARSSHEGIMVMAKPIFILLLENVGLDRGACRRQKAQKPWDRSDLCEAATESFSCVKLVGSVLGNHGNCGDSGLSLRLAGMEGRR